MQEQAQPIYEFSDFRLDPARRLLLCNGKPVPLGARALDTLILLVQNKGRVLEKDELLKTLWPKTFVEEGNLSQNIFILRKALGDGQNGRSFIQTIPRRGYAFVGEVNQLEALVDTGELQHTAKLPAAPGRESLDLERRLTEAAREWDGVGRDPGAARDGTATPGVARQGTAFTPFRWLPPFLVGLLLVATTLTFFPTIARLARSAVGFLTYTLLSRIVIGAGIGLQLMILYYLTRKRLHRRFFWFLVYATYSLVESVLRFCVAGNGVLYYYVYWLTSVGEVATSVLALRESFLDVFRPYMRLRWLVWLVRSCIGLALLYAAFKAWAYPPAGANRRGTVIIDLGLAVDYTVVVIALLYFCLLRLFKVRGHQWVSGIMAGFSIYAVFDLLALVSRSVFGQRFPTATAWIPTIAYIIAEIVWVVVLSRPEQKGLDSQRDLRPSDAPKLSEHAPILSPLMGRQS